MLFRINLFSVFLLLGCFTLQAQEIAIPYRDGAKWGMCNPEGKIIIEPKYDALDFYSDYSENQEMLVPVLNDKKGLIINGKVVFEAVYSHIYEKSGVFVLVSQDGSAKRTELVTEEGVSILKKPIIEIISSENVNNYVTAYHVLNADFTESIFIYDYKAKAIAHWLYENYHSITILEKQSDLNSVVFAVKKAEKDPVAAEAWDFSKLPKEKVKTKLLYRSEKDYLEKFSEKAYRYNEEYGSGSGSGSGSYDVKGDSYGYDTVVMEASPEEGESNKKPSAYYYNTFKVIKEQLVLEKRNQNNRKEALQNIPVNLKIPVKDLEIKSFYFSSKKNDTIQSFQNVVFYKKKGKQGILFSSDTKTTIEFDTISKSVKTISDYNYNSEIVLLVGTKDSQTKTFKYSFYSSAKGLLFPIQYDELTASKLYSNSGNIAFQARIGHKFGIIQQDGKEILKPEYDEIKAVPSLSTNGITNPYQLKKNHKFGLLFQYHTYKMEVIDTAFDREISQVFPNYPKREYKKTADALPQMILLSFKDKNGKLMGYANPNGMLYFKN